LDEYESFTFGAVVGYVLFETHGIVFSMHVLELFN
jgi:hypothetical protein